MNPNLKNDINLGYFIFSIQETVAPYLEKKTNIIRTGLYQQPHNPSFDVFSRTQLKVSVPVPKVKWKLAKYDV